MVFRLSVLSAASVLLLGCTPGPRSVEDEPKSEKPTAEEVAKSLGDATGVWATRDSQGRPYDLVLFANGQAVSTWASGTGGARGERGLWRKVGEQVVVSLGDGSTDVLVAREEGISREGYPSGTQPGSAAAQPQTASAEKFEGPEAQFVGTWRLNREPDGSYLYVSLQSHGAAFSTVNGLTEGRWEVAEGVARISWPDGWMDQIERAAGSWHKKSWVGGPEGPTADVSEAARVGETRFVVTP